MIVIKEELLKEHSRENALRIAEIASSSAQQFKALMACFTGNEYKIAQRASWSVSLAARKNPELIKPYLAQLVKLLERTDVHPAITRNTVRIFEDVEIPKNLHGELMNSCFKFIETPSTLPAVKASSLTILQNLCRHYAEIKHELKLIIEERWNTETAAFRARGKKVLQGL